MSQPRPRPETQKSKDERRVKCMHDVADKKEAMELGMSLDEYLERMK